MSRGLTERLNEILPTMVSDDFLSGKGLGNEIAFHVFDYPPEDELRIREHIQFLLSHAPKQRQGLRLIHIDLLDFVVDYLEDRKLLEKVYKMQREKGDAYTLGKLEPLLHPDKLKDRFAEHAKPEEHDLVLVSGVGSVFPLLRAHSLLNNLHPVMGQTPLILFYPGSYDGKSLRMFNKLKSRNYYRAFRLAP
jgi:hypothetical protein